MDTTQGSVFSITRFEQRLPCHADTPPLVMDVPFFAQDDGTTIYDEIFASGKCRICRRVYVMANLQNDAITRLLGPSDSAFTVATAIRKTIKEDRDARSHS